jgi:DNA-binding NarL/FixJ family response regulator
LILRIAKGHKIMIASGSPLEALAMSTIVKRVYPSASVALVNDFTSLKNALSEPTDLLVLDLDLSGLLAPHGVRRLRIEFPQLKLAVLAAQFSIGTALSILGAGAHGFVPKSLSPDELLAAFRCIQEGQIFVPTQMSEATSQPHKIPSNGPALTDRQRQVLRLISDGKSNKEIARALRIAEATVKVHASAAYRAIGVSTRARATAVFRHFEDRQGVLRLVS